MRILIAPDKFKGSLSATLVAQTIAEAFGENPGCFELDLCPIADGGEGTAEAIITAKKGSWIECQTVDAQNRAVTAKYGLILGSGPTEAVMEMSAASGLAMVSDLPLDPATASTYGTGLMMLDAIRCGAKRIIIGIGGSATNDGGTGMARALGFGFYNDHHIDFETLEADLQTLPRDLDQLSQIGPPTKLFRDSPFPRLDCEVLVACDVTNPLLGPEGCTRVYGRLAKIVERDLGVNPAEVPGAGAAGGLGFGLMAFCGAKLTSGFDLIADLIDLRRRVAAADFVITGEGRIDAQTLHGKGPMGVALMARELGKPVAAIAGLIEAREALAPHFDHLIQVKPDGMPIPEAIQKARELLLTASRTLTARLTTPTSADAR
jgi:glycerate kinase